MKKNILLILSLSVILFLVIPATTFAQDLGDVNNSGSVDIVDALMVSQYYVGLNPSGFYAEFADVDGDNSTNIVDALLIAQFYVGLITSFPASTTPVPATITILEAEDAYYNDALVETEYSGYSGTGYVNTTNEAGTYVEWTFENSLAGEGQFVFTFANGSTSTRSMSMVLSGVTIVSSLDFPSTGDWTVWTSLSVTANINSGSNTLRLTSLGDEGAPNLDKLEILSSGNISVPTPAPTIAGGDITIWMAGDSTMANGGSSCPIGYGLMFNTFFDSRVTVVNAARGGRSINTWMYEVLDTADSSGDCDITLDENGEKTITADWQAVLDGMQSGDYLIISFGINDGTSDCPRHADEETFKEDMAIMIEAAMARGANPILLTPVSAIICSGSTAQPTRGSYVDYTISVGQQYNVPVIDLHQLSINLYNSLGFCPLPDGETDVSSTTGGEVGAFFCDDHTHFDTQGATEIGRIIANDIAAQGLPLAEYLQ